MHAQKKIYALIKIIMQKKAIELYSTFQQTTVCVYNNVEIMNNNNTIYGISVTNTKMPSTAITLSMRPLS